MNYLKKCVNSFHNNLLPMQVSFDAKSLNIKEINDARIMIVFHSHWHGTIRCSVRFNNTLTLNIHVCMLWFFFSLYLNIFPLLSNHYHTNIK